MKVEVINKPKDTIIWLNTRPGYVYKSAYNEMLVLCTKNRNSNSLLNEGVVIKSTDASTYINGDLIGPQSDSKWIHCESKMIVTTE